MDHLALAVRDENRSRHFYATYLGFDVRAERMDDGVLMLWDAKGFQLALGPADEGVQLPAFLHFGRRLESPEAVHALEARLRADGVEIIESWDEPDYVSRKCLDPDGYVVELAWEPQAPT
jgi:catechol 2,3-dioxygenase-like lactoylglutathione lyase family enzyme